MALYHYILHKQQHEEEVELQVRLQQAGKFFVAHSIPRSFSWGSERRKRLSAGAPVSFDRFLYYNSIPAVSQWHFRRNPRIPTRFPAVPPPSGQKAENPLCRRSTGDPDSRSLRVENGAGSSLSTCQCLPRSSLPQTVNSPGETFFRSGRRRAFCPSVRAFSGIFQNFMYTKPPICGILY